MNNFKAIKIQANGKLQDAPFKITSHILQHGYIEQEDFASIAGSSEEENRLLSTKIFAKVPLSKRIIFQSKPVEIIARKMAEAGCKSRRDPLG